MNRRFVLTALAALVVSGPLAAQGAAPAAADPVAFVRSLYASLGRPAEDGNFSVRLAALRAAAMAKSRELDEPVAGIDFDFRIDAQDHEPGTARSVRVDLIRAEGDRAEVRARFRNGGPQELRYTLVREGGRWVIDEVTYTGRSEGNLLSKLYEQGAAGN